MVQRKREGWHEKNKKKKWVGPCGQWFVRYNKKLKKYYYLNKIDDRIDKLMWVFL